MTLPYVTDRVTFERVRFCPGCGRRIRYIQWRDTEANHVFEKKCPLWGEVPDRQEYHFWIIHKQPVVKRNRQGRLTHGAKKALNS